MTGQTPAQALYAQLRRRFLESAPVPPVAWMQAYDDLDPMDAGFLEDAAQAVIDAATEGSLRACGYTLADVARFLEAEAAAPEQPPAPGDALRAVYRERAQVVAFLAACYPSSIEFADDAPGWWLLFVDTPAGQMSWHIADDDLELFASVGKSTNPAWDGHTTGQKYERLAELTLRMASAGGVAGLVAAVAQPAPAPLAPRAAEEKYLEAERTVDDYREALTAMQRERDEARAVVDEMLGLFSAVTLYGEAPEGHAVAIADRAQLARCHKRSGLPS